MTTRSLKLRWPLLGACAAALVLVTTTALAGSGVGGVFNLGQVNMVDAQSTLSGNPGGSPQLKVVNSGTGAALRGEAQSGVGVNGIAVTGTGEQGQSQDGIGVVGIHSATTGVNPGVQGTTNSDDANGAAVVGRNLGLGPGLRSIVKVPVKSGVPAPPLAVNSSTKVAKLNADLLDDLDSSGFWRTGGNAGTTAGTNFLGTTDNQALELQVNGQRALRLAPDANSANVIGGFSGNAVQFGAVGATIAGGGQNYNFGTGRNLVTDSLGTVGGGFGNQAGNFDSNGDDADFATVAGGTMNVAAGPHSAVGGGNGNGAGGRGSWVAGGDGNSAYGVDSAIPGGYLNDATGDYSFAAGHHATAVHQGTFVWADNSNSTEFVSTDANQFLVRASGGAKIVRDTNSFHGTGAALQVEHAGTEGEAAWLRIVGSGSIAPVLNLLKHPDGVGNFLTCMNFDGTSTTAKCHIDKDGTFISGSDFAESLPARGSKSRYEPGDVLVASISHPGEIERSHRRSDRTVIGVYSTRPALLCATKGGFTRVGKNEIPVAITGIVPVKVSTENGTIHPGDLLTSSSLPGRAMDAGRNPAVGTVLAKSLGALARGRGMIRALVMLR